VAGSATLEPSVPATLPQHEQGKTGQLVWAPNVNSLSLDKVLKIVVTVVQQILTETNDAVLEEAKIALNFMERNGH
jgi:hypothetical protein